MLVIGDSKSIFNPKILWRCSPLILMIQSVRYLVKNDNRSKEVKQDFFF